MLNQVLHNQEEEEATLRNMTKVVNSQLESLQNLDFHMSRVLDHDETPIIYFDEAFEGNEGDSFTYCLDFTTRSGKVLQPELGIIHDQKLCLNIELTPKEVIDEALIEKVNEELKEHDDLIDDLK
ncbi:hypothetical protein HAX54_002780 [Datura stramonium]|uniref:Uncharacterized protein n=1 Tax=Datura stramonium TaxID=4076 RepID=A0ABS8T545_DATST|nr:hypothetical protein [Datura stramonium]